jgi:uncharacterized protein (TIGR04222 family)
MVEFGQPAAQTALYQRLQAFCFDRPDSFLSFSQRLMRENHWSREFTDRAIEEYRRFAFLAVVAGHPVTPSDQVDQVWHLHLTYTRSYWEEFCPQVLQMPFHHEPTRGGAAESQKFEDWYSKTLESYQQWFGELPPEDIWPPAAIRFGPGSKFVRVNAAQNWVLPKPNLKLPVRSPQLVLFLPLILILTGCEAIVGFANPLDLKGQEFLALYGGLMAIIIPAAYWLQSRLWLPDDSSPLPNLDTYEVAYLVMGKSHVVDTAIAALTQQGYVKPEPDGQTLVLEKPVEPSRHWVEQSVATAIETDNWISAVRGADTLKLDAIHDQLIQLKLMMSPTQSFKARAYPTLLVVALLGLGVAKIVVGVSRDKPVGFLIMLCFILVLVAMQLFDGTSFRRPWGNRTRFGDRALTAMRDRQQRPTSVDDNPQLPMLIALFGVQILAGSSLTDLRTLLMPTPSSAYTDSGGGDTGIGSSCSGGSSCGGGGGGCGGGGGGCGGCGGG